MLSDWFSRMTMRIPGWVAVLLLLSSCLKQDPLPVIPKIAYESMILEYDSGQYPIRGYLKFTFEDGDGDIGLFPNQTDPPYDSLSPYYYNLIIDYYEKRNGKFVKADLNSALYARIPYLTPNDPSKAIKGFVVDTIPLDPAPAYDTIKLKFFIYDRALNQSNIDSTPTVVLRRR